MSNNSSTEQALHMSPAPPKGPKPYVRNAASLQTSTPRLGQEIRHEMTTRAQTSRFVTSDRNVKLEAETTEYEEEEELKEPLHSLLQFDIKCESLQQYLQKLTNTVNIHSKRIAKLENERKRGGQISRVDAVETKIGEILHGLSDYLPDKLISDADENLRHSFKPRSTSVIGIARPDFSSTVPLPGSASRTRPRQSTPPLPPAYNTTSNYHSRLSILNRFLEQPESRTPEIKDMATKADTFGEKIKLLGEAVAKLLAESSKMKQKIYEMEIDLEGRMDWKSGKEEMKKKQEKLQQEVDQKVKEIAGNLKSHKKELNQRIADIDWKVSDLKQCTLKEFEDYRAKDARVNSDFASEVSRRVEQKILREIVEKNKMSQDIKKEVIQHFKIENEINSHHVDR